MFTEESLLPVSQSLYTPSILHRQISVQFVMAVQAFRTKPYNQLPKLAREIVGRFLKVK